MTLDTLSESSLLRLEHYLNSNPYREYSMNKPYFPKAFQPVTHTSRLISQPQSSIDAFHQLMDNQRDSLTLDRLAYKLRMKSDLNIDTLRETHLRRRYHHQHYHPQQNQINTNASDTLSTIPSSITTKIYPRQATSTTTVSTNTMKAASTDDLNGGIEGSAVRVGTLDDLIKQFRRAEFRLVRRPADYLDSVSTYFSSNMSTNDRTLVTKSHKHRKRPTKQPQTLTEYHFNAPTFPTTPSRSNREATSHHGLIYQYRTRERINNNNNNNNTDLPLLQQRSTNSPDQQRQRLSSLVIQERQSTATNLHDKRIQELREKSLTRTEKQLCVCNKLNIVDPFNSKSELTDSILPQLQQSQQQTSVNYIFPPVRPFGYLTKKTTDDTQQSSWSQSSLPRTKKERHRTKKKHKKTPNASLDSLDKIDIIETNSEENSQVLNDLIQSMVSVTDLDNEIQSKINTTINIDLNMAGAFIQNSDEQSEL